MGKFPCTISACMPLISHVVDIKLSDEELDMLEKAAAAHPAKRAVDPSKGWGLDIFEDAQQRKLHARL